MDQQTNKQEPRSTEGGQVKIGDKVWVLCEVVKVYNHQSLYIDIRHDGAVFEAKRSDCRPVEPIAAPDLSAMGVEAVSDLGSQVVKPPTKEPTQAQKLAERTMKAIWAANDAVDETSVIKDCLTTESNSPEIPDSSSDPVNPSHYKQGGIECIEAIKAATGDGFPDYLRGNVMKYLWRYKEKGGVEDLRKSAWYLDRLFKEVGE